MLCGQPGRGAADAVSGPTQSGEASNQSRVEPPPRADELGVVGAELEHHRIVRHDHRKAAGERHHAERDHEGRHADIGDEEPVAPPAATPESMPAGMASHID